MREQAQWLSKDLAYEQHKPKPTKYVRWRRMTLEEEEVKAKELGIKSPLQMMQSGEWFFNPDVARHYQNNFMVKEEFDHNPEETNV